MEESSPQYGRNRLDHFGRNSDWDVMLAVKFRLECPGTSIVICSVGGKRTLTFGNEGSRPIKTGYWLSISPTSFIKDGQEGFMF